MDSWLVLRRDGVILNQSTKRDNWSFKKFSKASFIWCLPIRQEILNISQIDKTFHGVCPPFFSRPDCNSTADVPSFTLRTALSAIPFVCDQCGVDRIMIPRKIFTGFANFQGIVSVNDFWLPVRLQELLQAPFGFLRSFCFARIRLNPLGSQVLHHDCISMVVSRFTPFTENFVIGCDRITKIFCTKFDSANTSSARSPCDFGPLTDLAISDLSRSE